MKIPGSAILLHQEKRPYYRLLYKPQAPLSLNNTAINRPCGEFNRMDGLLFGYNNVNTHIIDGAGSDIRGVYCIP